MATQWMPVKTATMTFTETEYERAESAIAEAEQFIARIERFLQEQGYGISSDLANGK